jgi:hypothetical protein
MGPESFVEARAADEGFRFALFTFGDRFEYETLFSVRLATNLGTDKDKQLRVFSRPVADATTAVCDYVFQLMTRSDTIWTRLEIIVLSLVSTYALARFWNKSRRSGGTICFGSNCFSDLSQDDLRDYLRVFEVSTGPHDRIELQYGTNWSQLRTATVANFLQRCQCAILLRCWTFPVPSLILDALRGDSNIAELQNTRCRWIGWIGTGARREQESCC